MAAKKTEKQAEKRVRQEEKRSNLLPIALAVVIIVIAAVIGYLLAKGYGSAGGQGSFSSFQGSFYSAPRVGIYVSYINGTTFSYADGCATDLIESMIASRAHHRNATTIDFMVIANSTSCLKPNGPLGSSNGTSVEPISSCLNVSSHEPSVFINYSRANTTSIRGDSLYTSGDALFLSECGIASELG